MRHYYPIITFLIFSWFFTACEEPVDFDLDESSRLIVTSHFSENKALVVYVSQSQIVTSNNSTSFVKNASISVFSGNEYIELMQLVDDDNVPYYRTNELIPSIGETYTIQVNVPGHDVVTATNSIPIPVPIDHVDFDPNIAPLNEGDGMVDVDFSVSVSIQDPEEHENYYHLFFYQEKQAYSVNAEGDTIRSVTDTNTDINITISGGNDNFDILKSKFHVHSFLVSDEQFNGELITLSFSGDFSYDPYKYLLGNFVIELRTVSKEYYDYWEYVNGQSANGSPLNDFFILDDNIINGAGVFAGYSTSTENSELHN